MSRMLTPPVIAFENVWDIAGGATDCFEPLRDDIACDAVRIIADCDCFEPCLAELTECLELCRAALAFDAVRGEPDPRLIFEPCRPSSRQLLMLRYSRGCPAGNESG
mmetsp:Transcript_30839/g.71225  ORF Transcript_30839/g.71225 Transcript_30839/m.71225 type:complete len:107 (+) Transcript_30839:1407-1727(+)